MSMTFKVIERREPNSWRFTNPDSSNANRMSRLPGSMMRYLFRVSTPVSISMGWTSWRMIRLS